MFTKFFEFLSESTGTAMAGLASTVLTVFGRDIANIEQSMPVIAYLGNTMTSVGIMLRGIVCAYSLVNVIASPVTGNDTESPANILIRTFFSVVLTTFSIRICRRFLSAVTSLQSAVILSRETWGGLRKERSLQEMLSSQTSLFTGIADSISIVSKGTGAYWLICIVMTVMFASVFIKIVLQLIERYCMLGILTYTSPLFFASLSSQTASGLFISWAKLYLAQAVLLVISTFGVTAVLYSEVTLSSSLLQFVIVYAMAKALTHLDDLMGRLNIGTVPARGEIFERGSVLAAAATSFIKSGIGSFTDAGSHSTFTAGAGTSDRFTRPFTKGYDAKVTDSDGKISLSHISGPSAPSFGQTASRVIHGISGSDISGNQRGMFSTLTTGGGIYGGIRNYRDLKQAQFSAENSVAETNTSIDSFNHAFETSYNSSGCDSLPYTSRDGYVSEDDLNAALHTEDAGFTFSAGAMHLSEDAPFMYSRAEFTDRNGVSEERLVAVRTGPDGLDPDLFTLSKYRQLDSGIRIYWQDDRKVRETSSTYAEYLRDVKGRKNNAGQ